MNNAIVWASVLEEARQRCPNGCRNSVLGGKPSTCRRCESAAKFAWELVQKDRDERGTEALLAEAREGGSQNPDLAYLEYAVSQLRAALCKWADDAPAAAAGHERSALLALQLERQPTIAEWNASWSTREDAKPGTAMSAFMLAAVGEGCLGRSQPEEPVFTLVARDKAASMIVREWADLVERMGGNAEKVADARRIADDMERWREEHGGGKVPD